MGLFAVLALVAVAPPKTTVYIVGDSTAANKEAKAFPETGWGMPLQLWVQAGRLGLRIQEAAVPRLYLAGMIPGLVLTSFFMLIVLIYCLVTPEKGGAKLETSWSDRFASLKDLLAPLFIFFIVVGSIYLGWATPTEAFSPCRSTTRGDLPPGSLQWRM